MFRRESADFPFTLLGEIDFNDSFFKPVPKEIAPDQDKYRFEVDSEPVVVRSFIDKNFTLDKEYIYSVSSVDAHGLTSNLSSQMSVKFNSYIIL